MPTIRESVCCQELEEDNGPDHKINRHVAYRKLARWCWGYLGRQVRVVLPACCVSNIRSRFPPPGGEVFHNFAFVGFQEPEDE